MKNPAVPMTTNASCALVLATERTDPNAAVRATSSPSIDGVYSAGTRTIAPNEPAPGTRRRRLLAVADHERFEHSLG